MSQVNLLPPEIRQRASVRRLTVAIALAGVAVLGILIVVYVLFSHNLSNVQTQVSTQQKINQGLQLQKSGLEKYQTLQTELTAQQTILGTATAGEVDWAGVIHDIQLIIPNQIYLGTLTGTVSLATGSTLTAGQLTVGNLSISGTSTNGLYPIARWVGRLATVKGWANPWVPTMTASGTNITGQNVYTFTTSVDLLPQALEVVPSPAPPPSPSPLPSPVGSP